MFKSFSVYAFTSVAGAAIPLLLLPVLTRHLTPTDYGVVAIFSTLTRLVVPVVSLGTPSAISVEYFRADAPRFAEYVPSALLPSFLSCAVLSIVAIAAWSWGMPELWGLPAEWVVVIPAVALVIVLQEAGVAMMRNVERPTTFAATRLSRVVLESSLTLLFVVAWSLEWRGRAWGAVVGSFYEAVVATVWMLGMGFLGARPNVAISVDVARFGAPLVVEQLGAFVLNSSDRFFIETFVGLAAVGLYSVGAQFGAIILMVHTAFETAYLPTALRALESRSREKLDHAIGVAVRYLGVLTAGWLALSLAAEPILRLVTASSFQGAAAFVSWIGLGYVLMGGAALLRPVALYRGRTRFLGLSALGLTVLNLALNYVLVRAWGAVGPAIATALSYGAYAILIFTVLGAELRAIYRETCAASSPHGRAP